MFKTIREKHPKLYEVIQWIVFVIALAAFIKSFC